MNKIVREIRQSIKEIDVTANGIVRARFLYAKNFIGFQGHFPGSPVLPGVCAIQSVLAALGESSRIKFELNEVVYAKYLSPMTCGEEVMLECRTEWLSEKEALLTATLTKGDTQTAKMQLKVHSVSGGDCAEKEKKGIF